jgi:hypothetical protein
MGDTERTKNRQTDIHAESWAGVFGAQMEMHNSLIAYFLLFFKALLLKSFFKTLLLNSFLFFKVSFLRLALSQVFSQLFFSIISLKVSFLRLALSQVFS